MKPTMITVALTGAETTRQQQPALPLTPQEIGIAAAECREVGAAIAHLHARLLDGSPTQSIEVYSEIVREVKARSDIIIQFSTGGAVGMSASERIEAVALKPEMATLTLGSVNFGDDVFMNSPADIRYFAAEMLANGVKPEYEIFDAGMMATAKRGLQEGWLDSQNPHFDFVLGVPGGLPATAETLMYLLGQLPTGATWCVAGMGAAQLKMGVLALVLGGHVRVGFEDNIYYRKGELAVSNAQLVQRIVNISHQMDRQIATPDEARTILGL